MTVTHVGTTKQYASGWESVFGKRGKRKPSEAGKPRQASRRKIKVPGGAAAAKKAGKKAGRAKKTKTR